MFNKILEWIADRSLAVAGVALVVAILLRFEKKLPRAWKRRLIAVDIAFAVAVFLLGALKDHLDADWKTRLAAGLANARQELDAANRKLSRIEPRTLTEEQHAIIAQRLAQSHLAKIIQIRVNGSDGEALEFANKLSRAIAQAGVSVGGEAGTYAFAIPPGRVNIVSNTGQLDHEAGLVKSCLESARVPISVFTLPNWPGLDTATFIFIGSRTPEL